MRGLVVLALLLAARGADARVILIPSIPRMCPGGPSWDKTASCIQRFGKLSIVRSKADLRLVRVDSDSDFSNVAGLYLYVRRANTWNLGGMLRGSEYSILDFARVNYGGKHTYRLDLSRAAAEDVSTDGVTLRPAWIKQRLAVFCAGDSLYCAPIVTSCDVYVRGRALSMFRGTLTYADGVMQVTGDRSRTGDRCQQDSIVSISLAD